MKDLPKRTLGKTGLDVTILGYGAMDLRGPPRGRDISETTAERILNAVLDAGINFIDTSIDYGVAEERIGKYISNRRAEYFLATKCGCAAGEAAKGLPASSMTWPHIFTAENIVAGVEQSLRRMRTEYLDLVQFHHSPSRTQLEEHGALEALLDLKRPGKVRFIGISGTLPNLQEQIGMGVFDAFQIPYSALEREHESLLEDASSAGAGIIVRGSVAKSLPPRHEGSLWAAWQQARMDDLLDGMSRMEFMLRFTFSHPDLDTTIVGTISPDHLSDNIAALLAGPLPANVYSEAKRRLALS